MRISDWSSDVCSSDLRSTRLLNDSVRDFLGGNVLVAADTSYDTDGIIRIQRLNVSAPAFRLTGGSGRYSPDGGISFAANAYSQAYGPLGVKVSGSLGSPVAYLTRSEEHTSELQSLMRIPYAVFRLNKKTNTAMA